MNEVYINIIIPCTLLFYNDPLITIDRRRSHSVGFPLIRQSGRQHIQTGDGAQDPGPDLKSDRPVCSIQAGAEESVPGHGEHQELGGGHCSCLHWPTLFRQTKQKDITINIRYPSKCPCAFRIARSCKQH
jgi:hypothetical protein